MKKFDSYEGSAIGKDEVDVRKLTLDQTSFLIDWAKSMDLAAYRSLSVQGLLDLYHDSIDWKSFEGWLEAEPKKAQKALERCAKKKTYGVDA